MRIGENGRAGEIRTQPGPFPTSGDLNEKGQVARETHTNSHTRAHTRRAPWQEDGGPHAGRSACAGRRRVRKPRRRRAPGTRVACPACAARCACQVRQRVEGRPERRSAPDGQRRRAVRRLGARRGARRDIRCDAPERVEDRGPRGSPTRPVPSGSVLREVGRRSAPARGWRRTEVRIRVWTARAAGRALRAKRAARPPPFSHCPISHKLSHRVASCRFCLASKVRGRFSIASIRPKKGAPLVKRRLPPRKGQTPYLLPHFSKSI